MPLWLEISEVLLGRLLLQKSFLGISMPQLCVFPSVTSGLEGAGFFSVWIKSCASWMAGSIDDIFGVLHVLRGDLLCLRSILLLFCGCMPYSIFSSPCLVRCTSRVLHVVSMMSYLLGYCELLLLSLVGIAVCCCSQILQRYVCNLICGDEFLIALVDSDF